VLGAVRARVRDAELLLSNAPSRDQAAAEESTNRRNEEGEHGGPADALRDPFLLLEGHVRVQLQV